MSSFSLIFLTAILPGPDLPASDLIRFPPADMVERCRSKARQAEEAFQLRLNLAVPNTGEYRHWSEAVAAAHRIYELWDCLSDARLGHQHRHKKLKALLGPVAYRTGQMPPSVPHWCVIE